MLIYEGTNVSANPTAEQIIWPCCKDTPDTPRQWQRVISLIVTAPAFFFFFPPSLNLQNQTELVSKLIQSAPQTLRGC